jgi:lipopolysaccharide assembly LptE-like protein
MRTDTRVRAWLAGAVVVLSLALPGCGYSLAGRGSFLPAYIKVIGVPMFVNNTSVFDVEKRITERVRSELIGRGKYKVQPDTVAVDGILSGEILSITLAPAAFTAQVQASRYVLTLTAKIEFKDVKADKVLWSNPVMQFREEFDVTNTATAADPSAFFGQDVNALDRLATEFARSVVSAILEAF